MSNYSVDFELDINGLVALLKSKGMQQHLERAGREVANAAGHDYGNKVTMATYEAIGLVYPRSKKAFEDNAENNTLLRALQSSGLPMSKE